MKYIFIWSLILIACILPTAMKGEEGMSDSELEIGMKAPDFSLPSTEGREVSLADFSGKWLILYFYPKDNTPGCTKEACSFRDTRAEFNEIGAVIRGVSRDSIDSHHKFIARNTLTFPLLSDSDGSMMKAYGVIGGGLFGGSALAVKRSTFLIDGDGVIRRIWRRVKVSEHIDEVLAVLKEIQNTSK